MKTVNLDYFIFYLFFLKLTEKTARYQQRLEEKQAENLRAIQEKEGQVKAEIMLGFAAATQYCSSTAPWLSLPLIFFDYSCTCAHTQRYTHILTPQYAEEMNGCEDGSTEPAAS